MKATIAYVHRDADRVTAFEESLVRLMGFDGERHGFLQHDAGRMPVRCGTDGLVAARNSVAVQLLHTESEWLFWVDTDMGFPPDALYQLLRVAHPEERPVVGALCFIDRQVAEDGLNGYRTRPSPSIFDAKFDEHGVPRPVLVPMYPVNAVMRVAATGSACILIHRSVFDKIGEACGPTWYERIVGPDNHLLGEDVSFCMRALQLDIPIHVHTGVRTTHFKQRWLGEIDHWRNYNPPPATDEVAVIVPVLRRPQNAEPFMRSLRASTGLARAFAVVEPEDDETTKAWEAAGAVILSGGSSAHTFAEKVNYAYGVTDALHPHPWLFICGDDVKFHPGWLDHAQHVADVLKADVVGTNDLGNPRVLAGEHATHLLIRRSYVDEMGASWDGPGVVAAEAYHHWFVDDEIVTAAKQRGVWQMAMGSIVEHLHPYWGKGEDDEVYQLGQSHAEDDKATWLSRVAVNT